MLEQVVTIYNRYGNDRPSKWGRHVLYDVHGRFGDGVSQDATGAMSGNVESVVIIPVNNRYCSPAAYQAAEDKSQLWTIQAGDGIFLGIGPEGDITGQLKEQVPGIKIITGHVAHIYGSELDHWRVTAK